MLASLSVQFRGDDVQTSQHRHDVAQRVPADQVREQREVDERRRPAAGAVGASAAVADEVKAQLAVGRLRSPRRLRRSAPSKPRLGISSSKCWISPSMLRYTACLSGSTASLVDVDVDRAGREVLDRLLDDLQALAASPAMRTR